MAAHSELPPLPGPGEGSQLVDHRMNMLLLRDDFFESVAEFLLDPSEPSRQKNMSDHCMALQEEYSGAILTVLLNDDMDLVEKNQLILDMQMLEDEERVKAFNQMAGHELLNPRPLALERTTQDESGDFTKETVVVINEDTTIEDEDIYSRCHGEVAFFAKTTNEDINSLLDYIGSLPTRKEVIMREVMQSGRHVAEAAVGAAIVWFVAKKLEKPSRLKIAGKRIF